MKSVSRFLLTVGVAAAVSTPIFAATQPNPGPTRTLKWAGCGISKNAFMSEMAAAYLKKTGVKIDLVGGGATKGIRRVSNKEVDIGGTCRHVIEKDNSMMTHEQERRIQLTPVAWDALAVIVHKDNPASNITTEQLRALFEGRITNWKQLGGNDAPIELYARKGKISGVGRTLRELVFNDYEKEFVAKHIVPSTGPLEKGIMENPNGIGVTGISSARKLKGKAKVLALDGKQPSYEHIKSGLYTLYRPLYIVTKMDERNPDVKHFVDFVNSDEGKKIMRRVGTVPYEDAINLWLTYLDQQNRAISRRLHVAEEPSLKQRNGTRTLRK